MPPFDHDDGKVQHSLLNQILCEHPVIFTAAELVSELAVDPNEFGRQDAVERAIRDLTRVRLLHRCGPLVLPTRAAMYFDRLWDTYA
jgi:hypothetical protein